jgi:hypothetical protein
MVIRNVSRLEKLGAPSWLRGLGVVVLVLILLGTLTLITFSWVPHSVRVYATLAFLWILALIALLFLVRRWRATVSSRQ